MADEWSGLAEEVFAELFAEDLAELVTRIGATFGAFDRNSNVNFKVTCGFDRCDR